MRQRCVRCLIDYGVLPLLDGLSGPISKFAAVMVASHVGSTTAYAVGWAASCKSDVLHLVFLVLVDGKVLSQAPIQSPL